MINDPPLDDIDLDLSSLPAGFLWGAATSAYQIEGGAHEDGKGESVWDRFVLAPGAIADGTTGAVACDHYHRWASDIDLMRTLGLDAYRFSIAWTRIIPEGRGAVNSRGLDFYERLVDGLLAAGIDPWPTLYHWDLPQHLEDEGGWPDRRVASAFGDYADVVVRRLGDRVGHWTTLNEPWETAFLGYHEGVNAPGRRDFAAALSAVHTQLLGHGLAASAIRASAPSARIGIVVDPSMTYAATKSIADKAAAGRLDGHLNRWFLDPLFGRGYPAEMVSTYGAAMPSVVPGDLETISAPLDFLGLNYYYSYWVRAAPGTPPLDLVTVRPDWIQATDLGWAIHPEGLSAALMWLRDTYPAIPIAITESGAVFDDVVTDGRVEDLRRVAYHRDYLAQVIRACDAGVPIIGYFAWALLDNFEWASGLSKRFGLVRVDFDTLERTIKASGRWYGRVAERHRSDVARPRASR